MWCTTWEGAWTSDWHSDGGVWEVGVPMSGPGSPHEGLNCAGTVLAGDYPDNVAGARLIRHTSFVVPSADTNPRLRFWHWFSFNCSDYGVVQIKVGSGDWADISTTYTNSSSGTWSCPSIDLSAYAGSTVQTGFFVRSYNDPGCNGAYPDTDAGWYIDEVCLVAGPLTFSYESFESGLGDWSVDRGTWATGMPTSGPGSAHEGQRCAGTALGWNYHEGIDTRLVSPIFIVPPASENPRLRFWHWFAFSCSDYGVVQIKVGSGNWTSISAAYSNWGSGVWSRPSIALSAYADSTVQVGFFVQSRNDPGCNGAYVDAEAGWFIDEVEIVIHCSTPFDEDTCQAADTTSTQHAFFENGLGHWAVDRGTWEVGTPVSGPGACHEGLGCAGTVLAGDYYEEADSRLFTPYFVVKENCGAPHFSFWHWFNFSCDDYGEIHIQVAGEAWQVLPETPRFTGGGTAWSFYWHSLVPYIGKTIRLGFFLHSHNSSGCNGAYWDTAAGWFIDRVEYGCVRSVPVLAERLPGGSFEWKCHAPVDAGGRGRRRLESTFTEPRAARVAS